MFCASINGIINTILDGADIIVCRETAADMLGLSRGWGLPLTFYSADDKVINSAYIRGICRSNIEEEYIIQLNGVRYTNVEYTICDMIANDCCEQTIVESLASYYYDHKESFDGLKDITHRMGIEEKLEEFTDDAIHYFSV